MKSSDFSTSRPVVLNDFTYVVIAEHCTRLTPNWAPQREAALVLNELIAESFNVEMCECAEGIFETEIPPDQLEQRLRQLGFVYNAVLDEIMNDFISDNQ